VLHEQAGCECGCGGGWDEKAARRELGNTLAKVRAGVWTSSQPVAAAVSKRTVSPTFHEYASLWLRQKTQGVIGDHPISSSTQADYRWRLSVHLLPFFASYRLEQIDPDLCLAFKTEKLTEAAELRRALDAGADLRDRRGRGMKPLGSASIRKLIDTLATILDEAIEDGYLIRNPARTRRMRVRVPKPSRTFLEMDELAALLDAAAELDPAIPIALDREELQGTRALVAFRAARGQSPSQIAAELDLAKSTVTYHLRGLRLAAQAPYVGYRAVIETLGRSGVRASELCDLRWRDMRLHERGGARFHVREAKSSAGVREVQMTPDLAETLVEHRDRLQRAGRPTDDSASVIPTSAAGGSRASAWARSSKKLRRAPQHDSRLAGSRPSRTSPHTRFAGPTSPSRWWPTTSTSSGS